MNHTYKSANTYRSTNSTNNRRTRCFKKRLLTVVLTFALVITGMLIGGNLLQGQQVQACNAYEEVTYYKSITVENGDTLWTIADEYMGSQFEDKESYIEEVKRLNHLTDDTINAGAYLMIPYAETVSEL